MRLFNFRKETSERSDALNWVKQLLIEQTLLFYDSIEGCNQNDRNVVTHLMERARVDIEGADDVDISAIFESIKQLESEDRLSRKIRFANCFDKPLTYVVYCNENELVLLFSISSLTSIQPIQHFTSFRAFSGWIAQIKGWVSYKPYREGDLPEFDKALRRYGTPWPTNIDCFVSDTNGNPVAILEYQNTKDAAVRQHCSNEWFLCRSIESNDIRRWTSQEILRVQSSLPLFIITWSALERNIIFKQVDRITIPYLPYPDKEAVAQCKQTLSAFVNNKQSAKHFSAIAEHYASFNLSFADGQMKQNMHYPPLAAKDLSFPYIYYAKKVFVDDDDNKILALSNNFVR